jgi:hypothetical protein
MGTTLKIIIISNKPFIPEFDLSQLVCAKHGIITAVFVFYFRISGYGFTKSQHFRRYYRIATVLVLTSALLVLLVHFLISFLWVATLKCSRFVEVYC